MIKDSLAWKLIFISQKFHIYLKYEKKKQARHERYEEILKDIDNFENNSNS